MREVAVAVLGPPPVYPLDGRYLEPPIRIQVSFCIGNQEYRSGATMAVGLLTCGNGVWAARDSNPARRIKSPVLYLMS